MFLPTNSSREPAFVSRKELSWDGITSPADRLTQGQEIRARVLGADTRLLRFLVSLDVPPPEAALARMPTGTRAAVKILALSNNGALVEVEPGFEGVITRKELSWDMSIKPADLLSAGQEIEAVVCGVDPETSRLLLSSRLLQPDPWEAIDDLYPVGSIASGRVINLVDFGAFIALSRGIHGCLHIKDMSWGKVTHPSQLLSVGQQLEVQVLNVEKERRRISLGLKQRLPNPWDNIEQKYPAGNRVKGKVTNLVAYGAFVELEPGVEGMVHITELSWSRVKPSHILKEGQEIEMVVLGVNRDESKVSLSVRRLEPSPLDEAPEKFAVGSRVTGTIRSLTRNGAFVEVQPGLEGFIHVSNISWRPKINHPAEVLKEGDQIETIVLQVDEINRRLTLGLKQLAHDPWEEVDTLYKVGDLVTGKITRVEGFGAFMVLQYEMVGLIHISQLCEARVANAKDVVQVGQEVTARIIRVDKASRRIGLSIKATGYSSGRFKLELAALGALGR